MPAVEPDGTLHLDAFDLPPSAGWSEEAKKVFVKRFSGPPVSAQSIQGKPEEEDWLASSKSFRRAMETLHRRLLDRIEEAHPCEVRDDLVEGVRVQWVTPGSGVAADKADRVLVNLHGGAFVGGAEYCGLVESLPVADVGGYRICVVDYRQGWEHRFPAASEDVATVVQALQADRPATSIGIFGYSAGGSLTAQSVAWLIDKGIPLPGAIAICSAGAGGGGDSSYLANRAMGAAGPPPMTTPPAVREVTGLRLDLATRPASIPTPPCWLRFTAPTCWPSSRRPRSLPGPGRSTSAELSSVTGRCSPREPLPNCTSGKACGIASRTTTVCLKRRMRSAPSPGFSTGTCDELRTELRHETTRGANSMELRQVMRTTPATREFTDDDVSDEVLYDLLEDARFAPNGGNRQAWRVIIVRDPQTKARIGELYDQGFREYAGFLRANLVPFVAGNDGQAPQIDLDEARTVPLPNEPSHVWTAPVLIVILLDTTAVSSVDSGLGRVPVTAGGSAFPFAHNILLAARDVGLGGHVTSVLARQEPALRKLLRIPDEFILATMVPLGRPVREITKLRRVAVEEFTTVGTFDGPAFTSSGAQP